MINQRWLINYWKRCLGGEIVPRWQSVAAEDLTRLTANLSFLDIVADQGVMRFLIRFHGVTLGRVYGSDDCRGKHLDEILPGDCSKALVPYHQAAANGCPVYTVHDVTDRHGRIVHFERLLLPFARDGRTVDRILASFEFICPDGAFDSHELMKDLVTPPALRLSATIERHTMA